MFRFKSSTSWAGKYAQDGLLQRGKSEKISSGRIALEG